MQPRGMEHIKDRILMAPMLGITDASFRTAFMKYFGGFDGGVAPFVRTMKGQRFKVSHLKDLHPKWNPHLRVVPQLLTNQIDDFINLAQEFFDLGYTTVNLNMGCPVPTAAGRGRGAGLIPEVEYVDRLLDGVLPHIPTKLSIKTRLGLHEQDELLRLIPVLNRYPLDQVIIHPRTAAQKYGGELLHEALAEACQALNHEVVFSGDIKTVQDYKDYKERYPFITQWMIGRGILEDPWLAKDLAGDATRDRRILGSFLETIMELYRQRDFGERAILLRLKPMLVYWGVGMNFPKPLVKSLRKSRNLHQVLDALKMIN